MWTFLFNACLVITADQHADRVADPGTDTVPELYDPPTVASISVTVGTDAGGKTVTVTGSQFVEPLEVRFGDAVAQILSVSDTELSVKTPASEVTGWVDVTVSNPGGEATLPSAYQYWADAAGQTAATGELAYFYTVGGYWDENGDYGRSTFRLSEPLADFQFYYYWVDQINTCVRVTEGVKEWTFAPKVPSVVLGGGTMTQISPSSSITMPWNAAEERFTAYDLLPEQITPGEAYDVSFDGTPVLPGFSLPGALKVPAHFTVMSPDIFAQDPPDLVRDHHFEWDATSDPADLVILQIGMLTADGSAFEQELYCAGADTGSWWIDPKLWTRWAPDRFVNILIGRYNTGDGLLPHNDGQIAVASQLWYYGGAISR